jgi:hypothetical protein
MKTKSGAEKWRKEHMSRKGKENISAEGQELLEDKEIWENETALHRTVYESRKRKSLGSNEDGLFIRHQKGPITSTFTTDWFLREGQGRELLGEWMKSRREKNPTDATYVGTSGYRKTGSGRRRSFPNKP